MDYAVRVTILITGGLGFIGSHYARKCSEFDASVVIIDKGTYASNPLNIRDFKNRLKGVEYVDICRVADLRQVLKKYQDVETVVNFAAESHVDRSINDASPFMSSNILGVFNLLEALKDGYFDRLVQVSTDEVYGSIESGSWDERCALQPRSPYSASKASADLLCSAFRTTHGVDVRITRCANNYGPNQSVEKLIPKSVFFALSGKPIEIYGDGMNKREWLHASDHVNAIMLVANGIKDSQDFIFNISGEERTNIDIVSLILEELGLPQDMIRFVEDRKGHDFRYALQDDLIRNKFGWEPKIFLSEGMNKTIDWYRKNPTWVSSSLARLNL